MARRAVQGYTEKSYYENIRFLGTVATNDPLNEGYFRQLVNYTISDTGQSVTPREGFLTTTLICDDTRVTLSDSIVIYKDDNVQNHVVFDYKEQRAFIVELSPTNVTDKMLVASSEISNLDWTDVLFYIRSNVSSAQDYYETLTSTDEDNNADLLEELMKYMTLSKETYKFKDINTIDKVLLKFTIMDNDNFEVANNKFTFMASVYYRENETTVGDTTYAADTLVFLPIDLDDHPTYDVTARNIASSKSIIPDPMQMIYEDEESPAGHTDLLWPALYVKNSNNEYMTNAVEKNAEYSFIPFFNLKSANDILNPVEGDAAHWAFMFEVVSTDNYTDEELMHKCTIFRSVWHTFDTEASPPFADRLFTRRTTSDFINTDKSLRHYKEATIMITVVPEDLASGTIEEKLPYASTYTPSYPTQPSYTSYEDRHALWAQTIANSIELVDTIRTLSETARFSVYDLQTGTNFPDNGLIGDFSAEHLYISDVIEHNERTISGVDLLKMCLEGFFKEKNVGFRLLPYATKLDQKYYDSSGSLVYSMNYIFYSNLSEVPSAWGWDDAELSLFEEHNNRFDGLEYFGVYDGDMILLSSTILKSSTGGYPNLEFDLASLGFFRNGYHINFYMRPYEESEVEDWDTMSTNERQTLLNTWAASAYVSSINVPYYSARDIVTTITEIQEIDPENVRSATKGAVYNGSDGDRYVVWHSNILYISEAGMPYYFTANGKRVFGERIVKALQFKNIILVFTTQHLYAVYLMDVERRITNADGAETIVIDRYWSTQRVLYNILTDEKYADAIQVFNQMVLFYSSDGQMFMIKPNTMIDSETQFTLQYFNKSANDVLANYDTYINERLEDYMSSESVTKDDVTISVLLSVNYIKIFYTVPGVITYILVYDVINNRYSMYDTMSFTDVTNKFFVEGGEMYVTQQDDKTLFSFAYREPFEKDDIVDMTILHNFKKVPIHGCIDPGVLNLNNHLNKRYRDLYIMFRNFSASKMLYRAEVILDGVQSSPSYNNQIEIQDNLGTLSYAVASDPTQHDLIEFLDGREIENITEYLPLVVDEFRDQNMLFDFEDAIAGKRMVHKAYVPGKSKTLRLKLNFVSKGMYKLEGFGIVYKERRV